MSSKYEIECSCPYCEREKVRRRLATMSTEPVNKTIDAEEMLKRIRTVENELQVFIEQGKILANTINELKIKRQTLLLLWGELSNDDTKETKEKSNE